MAVQGLPGGPAVIRAFVPDSVHRHGVRRAWMLLGGVGLRLLLLSVIVSDQLARSLVRPMTGPRARLRQAGGGELTARAAVEGAPEIRWVGAGLNRLAVRIGELLAHERENVADLSHRLRTPLTALRIDAESLRDDEEMTRVIAGVDGLSHAVNEIIREARRPTDADSGATCDVVDVVAGRTAFWRPLAEDQDRRMTVDLPDAHLPVLVPARDMAACLDILLENVFAHTPEGTACLASGSAGARVAVLGWWSPTTAWASPSGPGPPGPVQRRIDRPRPGHRLPHCRSLRRDADARAVSGGRGGGDDGPGPRRGAAEAAEAAHRRARLWRRMLPRRAEQRGARRAPVLAPEQGDGPDSVLPQP